MAPEVPAGTEVIPWLPARAPAAVARAVPAEQRNSSPIRGLLADLVATRDDGACRWLGLGDGATLVAPAGFDPGAPFGLVIPADRDWRLHRFAAERLLRRLSGERVPPVLPPEAGRRFATALRALDARAAGASHRDLAILLFGSDRVAAEHWPTSPLKAQVARYAAQGRGLAAEGWQGLLHGRLGRRSLVPRT